MSREGPLLILLVGSNPLPNYAAAYALRPTHLALAQSWPEISRLARESGTRRAEQTTMFGGGEA